MNEGNEHLPINLAQEYRVKLGKSFTFPENNAFHTLKYDFKPQSVDPTRPGHLTITEEEAVNVSLPVGQGESGDDYAQFRGPKKNCTKECILIIDRVTGEAILERISDTVQLKATRDSHKPMHRDRSVSPAPFLSQPKAPPPKAAPPKASYNKPSSTPHVNPSKKQQSTSSVAASNKKSKSSLKQASGISKSDSGGKNLTATPKLGSSGGVKLEKRRPKLAKASSLPKLGSAGGGQNLLQPKSDLGGHDLYPTQDISPLRTSSNPTPEPGAVALKRPRVSFKSSSSSSGSTSSDSDSTAVEEKASHDSHMTQAQRPAIPTVHSIQAVTSHAADVPKGSAHAYSQKMSSINPSSLHPPQKSDTSRSLSRSSSAGHPNQPLSQAAMRAFVDETSAQLLNRPPSGHEMRSSSATQPAATHAQSFTQHETKTQHLAQHPVGDKPAGVAGGSGQTSARSSSSSSSSDSDSSSGSSSDDSSSDGETDKEVADLFSSAPKPARQMSMSVLRSDLNLSESGSDSDL